MAVVPWRDQRPKRRRTATFFFLQKAACIGRLSQAAPGNEEIEICTNNDFAGRWAAEHLEKAYQGKYRMVKNLPEKEGCDYADLAKRTI